MKKEFFVRVLADHAGVSHQDAGKVLDSLASLIGSATSGKGGLRVPGIGSFKVSERAARKGVNPRTLTPIDIPARRRVSFKPAIDLARAAGAE
ncbi:HU family DNA-binding protein [Burkholderia sp. Ac-20349]|uniref:HU family DNA-binding protein n=1 Tax=Burkholderia sp. Ac-20349 TaxID=2703893 RepID=UPI00197BA17B|nr:HU family DNA-binding protein [Burkholderia sp. Ac-20349]MBN3839233.1 HU family DNA-binding protein [Burkholderia sp. Ac-20349]